MSQEQNTTTNVLVINDTLQIPLFEFTFRFSTSGGPGGQHVNKTASKATLFFDVENSPSLTDEQRRLIRENLSNRINKEGFLHVASGAFRRQFQNKAEALQIFRALVSSALEVKKIRIATKVPRRINEKRLQQKKQKADQKKQRKWRQDY